METEAASVRWVGRVTEAVGAGSQLVDGAVLDVANVTWARGYSHAVPWLDLDSLHGLDTQQMRDVVTDQPGFHVLGRHLQYGCPLG